MSWYAYRKKQRIHLLETFVKKRNKATEKTTTQNITYDESFPSAIFFLDTKIKKYRTIVLSAKEVEFLSGKDFNEIQSFFITFCFNSKLISEEEYEYNKTLLLMDDL